MRSIVDKMNFYSSLCGGRYLQQRQKCVENGLQDRFKRLTDEEFFIESARSRTKLEFKTMSHEFGRLLYRRGESGGGAPLSLVSVENNLKLVIGKTNSRSNVSKAAKHLVTEGFVAIEHSLAHGFVIIEELRSNGSRGGDERLGKGSNCSLNFVDVGSNVGSDLVCDRSYTLEELCEGNSKGK